jgi:hypothetical protein
MKSTNMLLAGMEEINPSANTEDILAAVSC